MIQDHNIDWIRKRKTYTVWELNALTIQAFDCAGAAAFTEGKAITAADGGTPTNVALGEVSTSGMIGIEFTAAGDLMSGFIRLPHDIDPNYPMGLRLNWTNSGAAAAGRGVTFILLTETVKKGGTFQTTINDALDTPFVESLVSGAWANEWTARAIKKRLALTREDIENGAILQFNLEADVIDASVADLTLLGMEIDYVPFLTIGQGNLTDRPVTSKGNK